MISYVSYIRVDQILGRRWTTNEAIRELDLYPCRTERGCKQVIERELIANLIAESGTKHASRRGWERKSVSTLFHNKI